MTSPTPPREDLRAAVAARRDLGPEYEDAIVEGFLDKIGEHIDRRVEERVGARPVPRPAVRATDSHRLALAIVSMAIGMITTVGAVIAEADDEIVMMPWVAIVLINLMFSIGRRRG